MHDARCTILGTQRRHALWHWGRAGGCHAALGLAFPTSRGCSGSTASNSPRLAARRVLRALESANPSLASTWLALFGTPHCTPSTRIERHFFSQELLPRGIVQAVVIAQPGRVVPFFGLTFALTWGLQVPGVLAERGLLPGSPNAYLPFAGLGIFGPCVAAIILSRRAGGSAAVKELVAPVLHWRGPLRWTVAAVLPAVLLTVALYGLSFAGRRGPIAIVPGTSAIVVGLVISVTEEIGWRGFALPRLQHRWGSVAASGILGVAWCLWHIPMFIGQGLSLSLMPVMLLFFTGGSLLFTAIYNGTHGSLLVVILAHWCAHLNNSHRALPGDMVPLLVHATILAALGLFAMRRSKRPRQHINPNE